MFQDIGKKCVFFAFCGNIDGDSSVTGAQHREKPRRGIFRKTPDTKDPGHDVMIIGKGMECHMQSLLIRDTTKEEREQIVADSLGNITAACDGCAAGIAEMYQDYIDGKRELKEINMSFHRGYISGMEEREKGACGYVKQV